MPVNQFHIDPKSAEIHLKAMTKVLRDTSMKRKVLSDRILTRAWSTIE